MNLINVKGTFDYVDKEQLIREYIESSLKEIFKEYGYVPLETPILCNFELLALKYEETDEILNEIYKLKDQGNRKLGLRYDLTVPFAKYIASTKDLSLPFKRYEIGNVFRDGPVKVGRNRQFVQCDVDAVGLSGEMIEAEMIDLFIKGTNKFKIDAEVKVNNRKLMTGILEKIGIAKDEIISAIKIVDKFTKLTEEEIITEFLSLNIDKNKQALMFKYFNSNLSDLKEMFKTETNPNIVEGLNEIENLINYLEYLEMGPYIKFTPSLARGHDYYTGNVFEVYAPSSNISSSIGGGGRYDNMITEFIDNGNLYPAVGISFGLNVIYEILKNREEFANAIAQIYIIPLNTPKESLLLASKLRELNINVLVEMQSKKVKKCFEYADRENIAYVIVLGEDEINNQSFKLKNMFDGKETIIQMNNLKEICNIIK